MFERVTLGSVLKRATARPPEPAVDLDVDRHQWAVSGGIVLTEEVL